jgi:hypothetical protein
VTNSPIWAFLFSKGNTHTHTHTERERERERERDRDRERDRETERERVKKVFLKTTFTYILVHTTEANPPCAHCDGP